jgi:hypothetical protein
MGINPTAFRREVPHTFLVEKPFKFIFYLFSAFQVNLNADSGFEDQKMKKKKMQQKSF